MDRDKSGQISYQEFKNLLSDWVLCVCWGNKTLTTTMPRPLFLARSPACKSGVPHFGLFWRWSSSMWRESFQARRIVEAVDCSIPTWCSSECRPSRTRFSPLSECYRWYMFINTMQDHCPSWSRCTCRDCSSSPHSWWKKWIQQHPWAPYRHQWGTGSYG